MKPEPLDLDKLCGLVVSRLKVRDKKRIIKYLLRQHIKSACEFYLRYKNKPELLSEEQNYSYVELWRQFKTQKQFFEYGNQWIFDTEKYNRWLFKLAFKGVIENERNKNKIHTKNFGKEKKNNT